MQNLNNLITYRYCLVYLHFDLNSSHSNVPKNDSLDSLSFERDFEVTRHVDLRRPPNSMGARLARALVQMSGGHSVFFRHMGRFTYQHVVGIGVWTLLQ